MGFPMGYSDIFLPKLFLNALSILGLIRKLIHSSLSFIGLSEFLEHDIVWQHNHHHDQELVPPKTESVSASLIRTILPVVKFSDLPASLSPPDTCAVCLHGFEPDDEIRRLTNCRHVFHRWCVDRWMDCDQRTCPLCRTAFVPDELQDDFNERFWAASGIPDLYGDYASITGL